MSDPQSLSLIGGALCLDFANTLEFRRTAREQEALTSFEDLRRWGMRVRAIDGRTSDLLRRSTAADARAAVRVLAHARVLREAIYDVLSPVARNALPKGEALTTLNAAVEPLLASSRLTIDGGGARRLWNGPPAAPERVLWPVAWST